MSVDGNEGQQQLARLEKVGQHARTLVMLVLQLPSNAGRYYCESVREAAILTLKALEGMPALYALMRRTRQSPTTFLWNQTLRLRDIPENCVTHLLMKWERWSCQLREICEELKHLVKIDSDHLLDGDLDDYDHGGDEIPFSSIVRNKSNLLSFGEAASVKDCEAIIRLLRSLFRKVRVRIITSLSSDNGKVVDDLFNIGESLAQNVENLSLRLSPPQDSNLLLSVTIRIVRLAAELVDVASEVGPEGHRKWFAVCNVHFDNLLLPLLERNPIR
jgi:hypothetical protein